MLVNLEPYWKIFAILLDVNPTTFVFEGISTFSEQLFLKAPLGGCF